MLFHFIIGVMNSTGRSKEKGNCQKYPNDDKESANISTHLFDHLSGISIPI